MCLCPFQSKRLLTWHLIQCKRFRLLLFHCNARFAMQHFITHKGLSVHLNSRHPGKTDSHDTETADTANNSVENNDNEPFVTSGEPYIDYSNTYDSADESVCVTTLNNKTKHAKVSFHKVIKYSYQETASSNASCSTQDDEEDVDNLSLRKPANINGYSKDDFKKALVDLQYHVENQEIVFEKLNRKQGSTEVPIDEDFDAGMLIITDSAIAGAQEAVLDILPVGVDNATIELTNQNDDSLLTIQSHLQY
jgi:hypothetical protein